jgi:hypothetical protein
MRKLIKIHPLFVLMTVLLVMASISLALFHHHENGQHSQDCAVCRFVQQIFCVFVLAFIAFIIAKARTLRFFVLSSEKLTRLFLAATLPCRAPPLQF